MIINPANATASVRVLLIRDNFCSGAAPAVTDVLQTASVLAPINITAFPNRFKVLFDVRRDMSINGNEIVAVKKYSKDTNHVKFIGTSGAIASAGAGTLFLILLSDQATNKPTVDYYFRLRYVDN